MVSEGDITPDTWLAVPDSQAHAWAEVYVPFLGFLPVEMLSLIHIWEHRSPPCAKGGQHGRAMQGGLQSQANDSAGCCDRVREHRLAVPTRDREHRLGAEARRQSLSRRSPTAPFTQGRSGGRAAILSLP